MKKVIVLLFCIACNHLYAIPTKSSYWHDADSELIKKASPSSSKNQLIKRRFSLNEAAMNEVLLRSNNLASKRINFDKIIALPLPSGEFERVYLSEYSLLSPELQIRYPEIKTWRLEGVDKKISGRLDLTSFGLHGMMVMPDGDTVYIDPDKNKNTNLYHSVREGENKAYFNSTFQCDTHGELDLLSGLSPLDKSNKKTLQKGVVLQPALDLITYRLALAGTAEYTAREGGTTASAFSSMITTINRVNALYQRDIGVTLQLVSDESLLYMDRLTDPYTSGDARALLAENNININAVIGSENYDIGHVFDASNFGGAAFLGSACIESEKAGGASGLFTPSGETFSIKYVAHEIAHQLGATHSFNSVQGACGGGSRVVGMAVEPGSGSSLMSYAGLCGSDNLQSNTDATFHWKSIEQVYRYTRISGGASCGARSASGTQNPIVDSGGSISIPTNTPFLLSGSATGGSSYSWDQIDSGGPTASGVDSGSNALIRQLLPTAQPNRYIPRLSDLFSGGSTRGETLPQRSRDLNFALVVRNGSGGVGLSFKRIAVTDTGSLFSVLSQRTPQNLVKGQSIDIVWDVAGTNLEPINCTAVDISLFKVNGEKNVLIENVDNDGAEQVTVPIDSPIINDARIMVSCADQSFFQISSGRINVGEDIGDIEPPIITIIGANPVTIIQGENYLDLGAIASDNFDASVTLIPSGEVDTAQLGSQQIIYTATDTSGNTATSIRTVVVIAPADTVPPVITLIGAVSINLIKGEIYIERGATAIDNIDSIVSVSTSGNVNTTVIGEYKVDYIAVDSAGNSSSLSRKVKVINELDTISPEITLIGNVIINLSVGDEYNEPGFFGRDNLDGSVNITVSGVVDMSNAGVYILTYSAVDSSGNLSSRTRTINVSNVSVADNQVPVITLFGDESVSLFKGASYVELGAVAEDNIDTNVEVVISGIVDTNVEGIYIVTYTAIDRAGNKVAKERTVIVVADTIQVAPVQAVPVEDNISINNNTASVNASASSGGSVNLSLLFFLLTLVCVRLGRRQPSTRHLIRAG